MMYRYMSKKDRKRREAARRQKEQRQAKAAADGENAEDVVAPEAAEPEDEAARIRRRAEQKREYEKRKRARAGGRPLAPYFWGGGVVAVLAVVALGGFLLLSGGGGDGSSSGPTSTPDPRIAGLPIDQTIEIQTDDDGQETNPRFVPNAISAEAGQVIEILVTNVGSVAHNLHFPGLDGEYDTRDDWLVDPPTVQPGETARVVVKFDAPDSYPFRCDFHPLQHLGTLTLS